MGQVQRSVLVHRPVDEVAKFALNPDVVLPTIGGFGRFAFKGQTGEGGQEWDLYLRVGTVHVGGRVLVDPPTDTELCWRSVRGTRHTVRIEVAPEGAASRVTMTVTARFAGMITGRLTWAFADGILGRHLEAGLQQLRHRIEYGDA